MNPLTKPEILGKSPMKNSTHSMPSRAIVEARAIKAIAEWNRENGHKTMCQVADEQEAIRNNAPKPKSQQSETKSP